MFLVSLVVFAVIAQQSAAPQVHCKLTRVDRAWQGTCAEMFGETPALTLSLASSVKSGRYRKDADPTAVYAGDMRIPAGTVPIEMELYTAGAGILRPEGLNWLVVANAAVSRDTLEFDLDVGKSVPPSDLDREIITRAASILSSEAVWDRADDRQCSPDDKTWSIYCSMIRASLEVTGGIHHRRPAMELVRQVVDERSAGRKYEHRLRDYNNDPTTKLSDVRSLFEEALARMKR
jgi:hypothetical protein